MRAESTIGEKKKKMIIIKNRKVKNIQNTGKSLQLSYK
jgi:hypothetical protein